MLVITTVETLEYAKKIAKFLVDNRYAACVNIIPSIISIYYWDDKLNEDNEIMLFIKSTKSFDDLKNIIKKIHPYEVPEIIKIDIEGNEDYINYLKRYSK